MRHSDFLSRYSWRVPKLFREFVVGGKRGGWYAGYQMSLRTYNNVLFSRSLQCGYKAVLGGDYRILLRYFEGFFYEECENVCWMSGTCVGGLVYVYF